MFVKKKDRFEERGANTYNDSLEDHVYCLDDLIDQLLSDPVLYESFTFQT
jgi:hypothetical protein